MIEMTFGPDEEKLARAFELIASLQKTLLRLAQRQEVDSMVIGLLLSDAKGPAQQLERWRAMTAQYYPARAVDQLGKEGLEQSAAELKSRIHLWTQALEGRLPTGG